MIIVDGKKIAQQILTDLHQRCLNLLDKNIRPKLNVILLGDNPASWQYVKLKAKIAESVGLSFKLYHFPASLSFSQLKTEIVNLQTSEPTAGLIIQLPLPAMLEKETDSVLNLLELSNDVDCLSNEALNRLRGGEHLYLPPTVAAILEIFKHYKINLYDKKVCLFGYGRLVGKPAALVLARQVEELLVVGLETPAKDSLTLSADIIITGVGVPGCLTSQMIKNGSVVIDCGTALANGQTLGDAEPACAQKASIFSPVPGGVGPITVAKLLENCLILAEENS